MPLGFLNMAGEDFAHYMERIPGCFLRIGAREPGGAAIPAHAPKFYAAEESIFVGAAVLAEAARVASDGAGRGVSRDAGRAAFCCYASSAAGYLRASRAATSHALTLHRRAPANMTTLKSHARASPTSCSSSSAP